MAYKPRPYWCEAPDEDLFPDMPCPACGATVSGNDPVRGVCQAVTNRPRPEPLVTIILTHRNTGKPI